MDKRMFLKSMLLLAALVPLKLQAGADRAMAAQSIKDKVAVVYFSWSSKGSTRFAAETIARKADARLFEIKPEKPYSSDYRACCDEAKPECYGKQLRPIRQIGGFDPAQYDVIFIGTPNWWGTMAPPVRTFVTTYASAFQGKYLCLFQTNGGGGMQRCGEEFAELLPGHRIFPPKAFLGSTIRDSVADLENFVTNRLSGKPRRK